jgi:hypothetical protein
MGLKLLAGQFFFKIDTNNNLNLVFAKSLKTDTHIPILHATPLHLGLTQLSSFMYPLKAKQASPNRKEMSANQLNL